MKARITSVRRPARWAILPAIAVIGVLAGLTNAFADQQATDDAMDNALNWRVARPAGPYARSIHDGTVHAPRHHNYR